MQFYSFVDAAAFDAMSIPPCNFFSLRILDHSSTPHLTGLGGTSSSEPFIRKRRSSSYTNAFGFQPLMMTRSRRAVAATRKRRKTSPSTMTSSTPRGEEEVMSFVNFMKIWQSSTNCPRDGSR